MPLSISLDVTSKPLQTAVDALMLLDNGNRMVERCAAFLGRLGRLLSSLSKSCPILSCIGTIADINYQHRVPQIHIR
jgi:hypothetical protein